MAATHVSGWDARARARLATGLVVSASAVLFLMLLVAFVALRDAGSALHLNLVTGWSLTASIVIAAVLLGTIATRRDKVASVCLVPGIIFLGLQIRDFERLVRLQVTAAASPLATAYFTLTGLHAASVLAGLIVLALFAAFEGSAGFQGARRAAALGALSLYWSFLAAVWVLIFVVAYFGGAA